MNAVVGETDFTAIVRADMYAPPLYIRLYVYVYNPHTHPYI